MITKIRDMAKKEMKEQQTKRKEICEGKLKKMIEAREAYNLANQPTEDDREQLENAQIEYKNEQGHRTEMVEKVMKFLTN